MLERECAPIAESSGVEIVAEPFENLLHEGVAQNPDYAWSFVAPNEYAWSRGYRDVPCFVHRLDGEPIEEALFDEDKYFADIFFDDE